MRPNVCCKKFHAPLARLLRAPPQLHHHVNQKKNKKSPNYYLKYKESPYNTLNYVLVQFTLYS
jgi:hypothetical protein